MWQLIFVNHLIVQKGKMRMNNLLLTLGDWKGEGHGHYEKIFIESNYDVYLIRQSYKASCKMIGLSFDYYENYTEFDLSKEPWRAIWVGFWEPRIDAKALSILYKYNLISEVVDCTTCFISEAASNLIMRFIALSAPDDLKYEFLDFEEQPDYFLNKISSKSEPINGWGNEELISTLGYGLF